jgi:hypothetical protein
MGTRATNNPNAHLKNHHHHHHHHSAPQSLSLSLSLSLSQLQPPGITQSNNNHTAHLPSLVTLLLVVNVHLGSTAAMPRCKQHAASSTLVLHVLGRAHQVRNTSEAREAAKTSRPCTVNHISNHCTCIPHPHWPSPLLTASYFPSQTPYLSCSSARTLGNPQAPVHAPDSQQALRPGTRCRWAAGAACLAEGKSRRGRPWAAAACRSPGGALAGAASRRIVGAAAVAEHIVAVELVVAQSARRWGPGGRRAVVGERRSRRGIEGIAAWGLGVD